MAKCEVCGHENYDYAIECYDCGAPVENGDDSLETTSISDKSNQSASNDIPNILFFSSTLMALLGSIVAYYLFSNANSGLSGIDSKIIILGCIVLIYQAIISFLCFQLGKMSDRVMKLEKRLDRL